MFASCQPTTKKPICPEAAQPPWRPGVTDMVCLSQLLRLRNQQLVGSGPPLQLLVPTATGIQNAGKRIIIIIIIQHLYSAIMSYADTEALVAPVKSE